MSSVRLCAVALVLSLAGCAVGNQHQYAGAQPDLTLKSARTVTVAVVDDRPYVVSGDKDADFVGLQRGGFGNPFDVTTGSGRALALDFQDDVVAAFKKRGVQAQSVTLKPGVKQEEIMKSVLALAKERQLVIELDEWKSDTYTNTALIYNIHAAVFDPNGTKLAEATKQGKDDLGGSFMNPPGHAKTAVPAAFKTILEGLLNDPGVVTALK
jgi:hypothetical protein